MFCPKCGQQNPDDGKFCRSCGTSIGNVSHALTSSPAQVQQLVDRKGRPVSYERAITKIFSGLAFIAVAIALAFTIGKGWWFWMLIPAFGSLGSGVAQWFQLRNAKRDQQAFNPVIQDRSFPQQSQNSSLPPAQQQWAPAESRYKTGDLVPPSVTDATTRHLEVDKEGQTMTLPKK